MTKRNILLLVLVLGLLTTIATIAIKDKNKQAVPNGNDLCAEAFVISKELVKQKMAFPLSAEFGTTDFTCEAKLDGSYRIASWVKSKNENNVALRNDYHAVLKFTGTNAADTSDWQVIYLTIE